MSTTPTSSPIGDDANPEDMGPVDPTIVDPAIARESNNQNVMQEMIDFVNVMKSEIISSQQLQESLSQELQLLKFGINRETNPTIRVSQPTSSATTPRFQPQSHSTSRQLFTSDILPTTTRDTTFNNQLTTHNTMRQHYRQQPPPAPNISTTEPLHVPPQQPSSSNNEEDTGQPFPFEQFPQHVIDPTPESTFQPSTSSYYDDLMKDFAPHRKVNLNVTRSEVPSNPSTSQCKLRSLEFDSVQKFIEAFVLECGKYLGEDLLMADYMSLPVLMQLRSYERTANVTNGKMQITANRCNLPNHLMYRLIFLYSGPKSKHQWLINFVGQLCQPRFC